MSRLIIPLFKSGIDHKFQAFSRRILAVSGAFSLLMGTSLLVSFAQAQQKLNVADYFVEMPVKSRGFSLDSARKLVGVTNRSETRRVEILYNNVAGMQFDVTKDIANDYLRIDAISLDPGFRFEVSVWRTQRSGVAWVGVQQTSASPTPVPLGNFRIFQVDSQRWSDVTQSVVPKITRDDAQRAFARLRCLTLPVRNFRFAEAPYFEIPKRGTAVKVIYGGYNSGQMMESDAIASLEWRSGQFVLVMTKSRC